MWIRWIGALALCMLTTACHLVTDGTHNLSYEAKLNVDEFLEHRNYEKLASLGWEMMQVGDPHHAFSKDFTKGFKDGFVDFLQFGGLGQCLIYPPNTTGVRIIARLTAIAPSRTGSPAFARVSLSAAVRDRQFVTVPSANMTEPSSPPAPETPLPVSTSKPIPRDINTSASSPRLPLPVTPPREHALAVAADRVISFAVPVPDEPVSVSLVVFWYPAKATRLTSRHPCPRTLYPLREVVARFRTDTRIIAPAAIAQCFAAR